MLSRRMVVKVGSSSLTDAAGRLVPERMRQLVDMLCRVQREYGREVVLVSSGAVAAGLGRLGWRRETLTIPEKQAAAAVGQGLLIDLYERLFAERGLTVAQLLLTRSDVEDRRRFVHIRNTLETLLRHGVVPIVNENDTVAVDEIRFGDNDTLSALVALVVQAGQLVLLTDIDGLYTADPRSHPEACRIEEVAAITPELERLAGGQGSPVGTGGMRTKLAAARIATKAGIEVVIASSTERDVLPRIAAGERVGTHFAAHTHPLGGKKSWVAFSARCEGMIWVDHGAAKALLHSSGSLLLPGITRVDGDFHEGSVVEVRDPDGRVIAKGTVNFSAADLRLLLAQRRAGAGVHHVPEVVHRNDMVVLGGVAI